jgi:hypothetical protein
MGTLKFHMSNYKYKLGSNLYSMALYLKFGSLKFLDEI